VDRGAELVSLLEQTSPAALTPHAARLLELLEHTTFRRANSTEMTPREAIVRAVMRLGYRWALQLSPEDVGLARLEEKRQQRQRSSRVRRLVMVALGVVGLAVAAGVAATREKPVVRDDVLGEGERVFSMAMLDEVAPKTSRGELLATLMMELAQADRFDDAVAVGFDCLADPEFRPSTCLRGLARAFDWKNKNSRVPLQQRFSLDGETFDTRWEVARVAGALQ